MSNNETSSALQSENRTNLDARKASATSIKDALEIRDNTIGYLRVALFAIIIASIGVACKAQSNLGWLASGLELALFVVLIIIHDRIATKLDRAKRQEKFYVESLMRIDEKWRGNGKQGARHFSPEHPYAVDLDIFGRASLYELLCRCQTRSGEDCLASWLKNPASVDEIKLRQKAVAELSASIDHREAIFISAQESLGTLNPAGLIAWAKAPSSSASTLLRLCAAAIALMNIAGIIFYFGFHFSIPLIASLTLTFAFNTWQSAWTQGRLKPLTKTAAPLREFAFILAQIEEANPKAEKLISLKNRITGSNDDSKASRRIEHFQALVGWMEASLNQFFAIFAYMLIWQFQFAAKIEQWRIENGASIEQWLKASGEYEALCSLAAFAYENPTAIFPNIENGTPVFRAIGLEHPLISRATRVDADIEFGAEKPLLIVSGSNMSGKSTLMRSVGISAALALCGAPVIAKSLSISPVRIGASIRTLDSLQDGVSRFYAEIQRIKQIVDMGGGEPPLMFLLDEILHGTNSHDRLIGAEAILRGLVKLGAIGIVTTHDLALSRLENDSALGAVNVHLEDEIIDGKMIFDYKLRPGVVQKSNAIALMRGLGLDV